MTVDELLRATQLVLSFAKDSADTDPLQRLAWGVAKTIEVSDEALRKHNKEQQDIAAGLQPPRTWLTGAPRQSR